MTSDRQPVRAYIDSHGHVHPDPGAPPDTSIYLVPEDLWDQMLPPVPLPDLLAKPVFPLSDIDLRMWAVEQVAPLCDDWTDGLPRLADLLIAYVRGDAST